MRLFSPKILVFGTAKVVVVVAIVPVLLTTGVEVVAAGASIVTTEPDLVAE
jgi:hypothetical protein